MKLLLIVNETELNDIFAVAPHMDVVREWAQQRTDLGSVDVVDADTGRIVLSF